MAQTEDDRSFTLTSTGTTSRMECLQGREWFVVAETRAGSTATFQLQTARDTSSTTVAIPYGTEQNLGASSGVCLQFAGPLILFVRVSALTSTGTIHFRMVAN